MPVCSSTISIETAIAFVIQWLGLGKIPQPSLDNRNGNTVVVVLL